MATEAPPAEIKDTDFVAEISMQDALDAYQRDDKATVDRWYLQQNEHAKDDPTGMASFQLSIDFLRLQLGANDREAAKETFNGVHMRITEELKAMPSEDTSAGQQPEIVEKRKKLKDLLQQLVYFRGELMR